VSVFGWTRFALKQVCMSLASLRFGAVKSHGYASQYCSRLWLRAIELVGYFGEPIPESLKHPCGPGRNARQDIETDQEKDDALKYRQDNSKYAENYETPADNVDRDAFEFRCWSHFYNESLTDAVLGGTGGSKRGETDA
jgi:hypothetical protein